MSSCIFQAADAARKQSGKDAPWERQGARCDDAEQSDEATTTNQAGVDACGSSGAMNKAERRRAMTAMRTLQAAMRAKKMYSDSESTSS